MPTEPGVSLLDADRRFGSLHSAPTCNGTPLNLTRPPFEFATEEIVQLCGSGGFVSLDNLDEHYRVAVRWNAAQLPHCMLWFSNRGRQAHPWAGRHLAIGIEPNCAPFDLGQDIAQHENPMNLSGWPTAISIDPAEPFHTSYRIEVSPMSRRPHPSPFLAPHLHSEAPPT